MPILLAHIGKAAKPITHATASASRQSSETAMNHPVQFAAVKRPAPEALLSALQSVFGERFSATQAMREHQGRDESSYDPMLPDAVIFAHSTEEVAAAVKLCGSHDVPVIAYGAGTSLEGHVLARQGGPAAPAGGGAGGAGGAAGGARAGRAPGRRGAAGPPPARPAPGPGAAA